MKQTEKKRKAILDSTFQLLNEKEIKSITVEEIAEKAEVSKVTIFKYYQNKNHLMNLVIQKSFDSMIKAIQVILESDLSFEDSYKAITERKLQELKHYNPIYRENLMTQYSESPDFFDDNMMNIQTSLYDALYEKGLKEGKISTEFSKDDFIFIFHIFTEGMKGHSTKSLIEKTGIINRFFLKGFS